MVDVPELSSSLPTLRRCLTSGTHGLTPRGGATAPRLLVERRFAAGEIDAVRLTVAGVRRGNVRVRWTVPGSDAVAGTLDFPRALAGGTLRDQYYFDLTGKLPAGESVELESPSRQQLPARS